MMKILVTGAGGFIGSNLVSRLSFATKDAQIVCMTRNAEKLKKKISNNNHNNNNNVKIAEANVMDYVQIKDVLSEIDIAYYLIHSMEGVSAKEWKKFAEKDRKAAENFAKAATECKVKRIIYLGGLIHEEKGITNSKRGQSKISEHMQSRIEVGNILKTSSAKVTIFRAAVILGKDGASYKMLRYLVERLPVMVCPKWVLTNSQPISIDDVITYLVKSIEKEETEGMEFDIGGPDTLRYIDMMRRYAKVINKKFLKIIIIPFLTPRLSSYWVELITPTKASLVRPLIESLKYEAVVRDNSIKKIIPIKLKTFEEAIIAAKAKEDEDKKN
jgi:uncharacterized protein YbjT (DUF2867 family)